jgi:DNA-binding IclR family transcriptional regulator
VVLHAIADGSCALAELVTRTGLPRATAYRLAGALVAHRLLSVNNGVYALGPWLDELASAHEPSAMACKSAIGALARSGCVSPPPTCRQGCATRSRSDHGYR